LIADPVEQSSVSRIAEPVGGVEEGDVAGLVGPKRGILDHTRVVLDRSVGDHHITDIQVRIQSTAHPGKDDHGASEPVRQEGGHHGDVDLAHARHSQNCGVPVEFTDAELNIADPMGCGHRHRTQKVRMLLGQRAD
jgi:hypothetical protein